MGRDLYVLKSDVCLASIRSNGDHADFIRILYGCCPTHRLTMIKLKCQIICQAVRQTAMYSTHLWNMVRLPESAPLPAVPARAPSSNR